MACASSRSLDDSFSDIGANAQLKSVLFADRQHDYADIDITIYEGRLMLTGSMRTEDGRAKLIENAWKAEGIEVVIDEVVVSDKTPFLQGVMDSRIDQAFKTRLIAAESVVSSRYKVAVSNSVIYLIGAARDQAELDEALAIASTVSGVSKVVTHVALRAPGDAQ